MADNQIRFEDFSQEVIDALEDKIIAALHEAAGELEAQVKRNTRVDTGQLKGSWTYKVDESKHEAYVGSPSENAIWEEYGTGEYAVNHDGRKGGWWIKVGSGKKEILPQVAKRYGWKKVIREKAKKGKLKFVFTTGKKPSKALQRAAISKREKVKKIMERNLK